MIQSAPSTVFSVLISNIFALGWPVEFWDDWLVLEVVNKLSFETTKLWELSLVNDEPPTFEQLSAFLEIRCRSLSMLSSSGLVAPPVPKVKAQGSTSKFTKTCNALSDQNSTTSCPPDPSVKYKLVKS
ncbi:unnamed protein product [Ceratitis capitata]|uniref:(Mediterranean fruit fly) hypothetical protein n=1 Tax=Ceratitis capitata TaxID=7213 RepID=A0A811UTD9_CERCA|nr:unnamed protein product [Ceratitis capitata]